jgi:glycosyltransferase involved in cell wall biosynthesis
VTPPTVLHVLEALGGGTARHLLDIVRYTPGVQHEVAVPRRRVGWLSDESAVSELQLAGAVVHVVEMRRTPAHPRNLGALARLAALIRERRPAVVHGHSSVGGALARVAASPFRVPRVYTPNGIATSERAVRLERWLGRLTDRLVAVSESEAELALRLGLVPDGRLVVVPNGVNPDEPLGAPSFDIRARLGLSPDTPLVGCLARLVPQKAPEVFVTACAQAGDRLPGVHFVLFGNGGVLADVVAAEIARSGLGNRFHDLRDPEMPVSLLSQLDIIVSTSRFEGAPYTPLDAIRAGTVLVLSDVVGNRDVVEDRVSGLLVPVDDPGATADAIVRLIREPGLRGSLAAAAGQRMRSRFDVRVSGFALRDVYLGLLSGPGPP